MLSDDDITDVREGFEIYDHEWRAYAPVLGEPYLVDGYLVYFDGVVVYVCAYRLSDIGEMLSEGALRALLEKFSQGADAQALVIWGKFEAPAMLRWPGHSRAESFERVLNLDYDPTCVDSVIDLAEFDKQPLGRLRAICEKVQSSGLEVETVQRNALGADHLRLVDEWARGHAVLPVHAALATGVASFVSDPDVYLTEARSGKELLGFAVTSLSSPRHAVLLQNFNERRKGIPVGDAVYRGVLNLVSARSVAYLHLGYSVSAGLLRFKRKWGAHLDRPPYREAGFTNDTALAAAIGGHRVTWRQRLLSVPEPPGETFDAIMG